MHRRESPRFWIAIINAITHRERHRSGCAIVIIRDGYLNRCAYVVNQQSRRLAIPTGRRRRMRGGFSQRTGARHSGRASGGAGHVDAMTRDSECAGYGVAALRAHLTSARSRVDVADRKSNMPHRVVEADRIDRSRPRSYAD